MDDSLRDALNKILSLQDRSKRKLEGRQKEFLESLYQDLELIYVKDDVYVDGDVIKCKCRSTKEKVAIKIINIPEEQKKNGVPSTVIQLVSILKALDDHPNIIRLMYVAGTEDEVYLSFEQFDETSLHRYLCYRHLFSRPQELKFILHEILSGVAHCHAHKILHRDLTPHNILLQTNPDAAVFPENLKLTGFGEASTFEIPHSSESAHVCHPFYRAPEHLLGSTEYSTASDIWSVGCIFSEMFKRKPLFNGDDNVWMLAQIFCLLGPPTEETWPGLSKLCNFEVVLDPTKKPKSLEEEFRNLGPAGVDLLSGFSKNFKNLLPIVLESFPSFGFRLKETIKKMVAGKSSCRLFQNLALVFSSEVIFFLWMDQFTWSASAPQKNFMSH